MPDKSDLAEEIREVLADPKAEPWFPSLTRGLVGKAEEEFLRPIGLSLSSYGTERFLKRDPRAERIIVCNLKVAPHRMLIVEQLGVDVEMSYGKLGLKFPGGERLNDSVFETLQRALEHLETIPSLRASTTELVRSLHVLDASDDAYDISHSDPAVPFSVFVSVPSKDVPNAVFRVMESLVHEAMHLQLTLIEGVCGLVRQSDAQLSSPWRAGLRPPAGLLHGIYVFNNIAHSYQLILATRKCGATELKFIRQRLDEIGNELGAAFRSLRPDYLTSSGQILLSHLRPTQLDLIGI